MHRSYKTTAIILKNRTFGDVDRLYTVYTKEMGKIVLKGKGVKRAKSKLSAHLESINEVSLDIAKGKGDFDIITGALAQNSYPNIKDNLSKTALAYYFLESLDKSTHENEKNHHFYLLIRDTLGLLSEIDGSDLNSLIKLETYYTYSLLKLLGHAPKIDACLKCESSEHEKDILFSIDLGGVICNKCPTNDAYTIKTTLDIIKILNAIHKLSPRNFFKTNIGESQLIEAKRIVNKFSDYQHPIRLNSYDFFIKASN